MKKMKKSKPKARSLPAQALQKSDPPATEIGAGECYLRFHEINQLNLLTWGSGA